MIYAYKCTACNWPLDSTERADRISRMCIPCSAPRVFRRVFQVRFEGVMQEHFNNSIGKPISCPRQFERELRDAGDLATQQTGIEHRYAPCDLNDKAALGVDGRGIDESNRLREKRGAPLLPDIS